VSRTQRFFRIVWRINSVFVLLAGAVVCYEVISMAPYLFSWNSDQQKVAEAAPPVGVSNSGERLVLRSLSPVPGTTVLRGELETISPGNGPSSSFAPGKDVRNLLFVKDHARTGHWLLPDNDHIITEHSDISAENAERDHTPPIATVVLVKPAHQDLAVAEGTLLLFATSGDHVQTVATGVRELHSAVVQGKEVLILFERNRKYRVAVFESPSLQKKDERELEVPQLK